MSDSEKPRSLKDHMQSIKYKWLMPFIYPEWLCEQFSYFLGRWAFLDILGHIGRLTILIAVITYFMDADERRMQSENQRKAKHYQAWQVINSAHRKPGDGGRTSALQDLNKDKVLLTGVDISKAYLPELNLDNAELRYANFAEASLPDANLAGAVLIKADLTRAKLSGVNLTRAKLHDADFAGAYLDSANLTGAKLIHVNLTEAKLDGADLAGADLSYANLTKADLLDTNLAGAELDGVDLTNIANWKNIESVKHAIIHGVINPPDGFIEWAKENGAVIIENSEEWEKFLKAKQRI